MAQVFRWGCNMVRLLFVLMIMGFSGAVRAVDIHPVISDALCKVAAKDGELPVQIDVLIDSGLVGYSQASAIMALPCGDRSLLEVMVDGQAADNLEYMVVDMGVSTDRALVLFGDRRVSVNEMLEVKSKTGGLEQRLFASEYRVLLADEDFNPSVFLTLQ